MPWSFKLSSPIDLTDGRRLEALADARAFIFALPERRFESQHLKLAIGLLDEASRDWMMVAEAEVQIRIALKAEGLI
jgi:hypothetical protein